MLIWASNNSTLSIDIKAKLSILISINSTILFFTKACCFVTSILVPAIHGGTPLNQCLPHIGKGKPMTTTTCSPFIWDMVTLPKHAITMLSGSNLYWTIYWWYDCIGFKRKCQSHHEYSVGLTSSLIAFFFLGLFKVILANLFFTS